MSYVYLMSETAAETGSHPLYTVGFYNPEGKWIPESDHGGPDGHGDAVRRVAYLNGRPNVTDTPRFTRAVQAIVPGADRRDVAVEATVDFFVNEALVAGLLGRKALKNRTGRSELAGGAIVAEVRNGSRKPIQKKVDGAH